MAQTYTRQSTFADGDTITAALFNDEYNQLVNAFTYSSSSASSTGHRHDGTAGQGGNIHTIGDLDFLNKIVVDSTNNRWGFYVEVSSSAVEQIRLQDGALLPVTDSDVDLGTSSLYFKNAYIDAITTTGNVSVGGNLDVTGTIDFSDSAITNVGSIQLDSIAGDADSNTSITFSGSDVITIAAGGDNQVTFTNGAIVPSTDNDIDLGTSSTEFKDAYFDGTVTTDALVADTADINGGTIDGAIIGGSSAAAITGTAITGTSFVIGSADISEAELETIDGVTAGTVAASKAVVVDSNKDIASFRNITLTGELDAGSLDVSGDVDVDGTLETDALSINGTAVTSTAAELNILDGVTSTAAELNILDGVTSTTAELNILDGVTATAAEINALDGITSTVAELNILDGVTASAADINLIDGITNGTVIASKAIITDANKDITGGRNITISGELDAATLDISGDADIDGTLEADAITIGGVTLAETISDTVGAMVTSNTETGIAVTYDDSDNTLDFVIGTLNQDTTGLAATATALATARTIHGVSFDGTANIDLSEVVQDTVGAMFSSNTETNITATYQDADGTIDLVVGTLNQDTTGNAATATALETARTIHGVSFDGTANIDLSEVIQDTVGAMVSSNTESGITVAYEDSDGTLDFTVGTLNQDTTGNAATATALETARTIHGVSFDGTANIDLTEVVQDTVGAMFSSNTETGITATYQDSDGTIDLTVSGASVTSIADADADTKIQVEESSDEDTIRMDIAGTEVLTLTNSAMTLKGTTPTLTIGDAGEEDTKIVFDGNAQDYYIGLDDSADTLVIGNGSTLGTEAAITINSSEQVGIGTATMDGDLHVMEGSAGSVTANGGGNIAIFEGSGNKGISILTPDANNAGIFFGSPSDAVGARIVWNYDSNLMSIGPDKSGASFKFTSGDGAERMRIDSSGNVGINTSSPAFNLEVQESSASTYAARVMHTGNPNSGPPQIMRLDFWNTPNNGTSEFLKCRDTVSGTAVNRAVIMSNGGIGNFTTNDFNYSDERMKKDINNATAQLDNVKKLQLKTFRYKEQEASEPTNLGVVAQDIQTDFPTLVTEQGEGDEARLGVKEQQIMWMAVKAIQEQQDIIDDLKSRIETLEG